jgi:diguanylate cyclase (GGDEF)-like protein
MNLQEAIRALEAAIKDALELSLKEVIRAALLDDQTPLGNAQALKLAASLVGSGEDKLDVVIFGDLNRFKNLNDQFGHDAGDAALNQVGQLIKKSLVEECQAQAFHRSGDEFVVLLSSHSLEQFKARLPSFAPCTFQFNEETRKTAMSFGYAVSQGGVAFDELLARAEIACQIAKSQGDGICVEWSEEIQRQAIISLRDHCLKCDATITCSVPQQSVPRNRNLLCCPCCGELLAGIVTPMPET